MDPTTTEAPARPADTVIAHDLLDLHDEMAQLFDHLGHPASIDRWVDGLGEARGTLRTAVLEYELALERMAGELVNSEMNPDALADLAAQRAEQATWEDPHDG